MGRASVVAAGFALAAGSAADASSVVHIGRVPDRFGRILLACVEPLEPSPRGKELAVIALGAIRETFAASPASGAEALVAAFAAANAAVLAENRPLTSGRWERRICVGATGVAMAGREITVAQVPPSQAMLAQDGRVYAFPDLASWRGDYVPADPTMESHPLGFGEDVVPRLYQSEAASGDLIALTATSVGCALGRDDDAIIDLHGGSLLTGDLEGSVDRLERLIAAHDVADGFAVVAVISRLPGRTRRLGPLVRGGAVTASTTRHADNAVGAPTTAMHAAAGAGIPAPTSTLQEERPPVFEGLRDWAVELAELIALRHRQPAPVADTRQRILAAPGALSVRRYRDSSGVPAEWRAILPRGPGLHLPTRLLAVSLVLVLMLGGTGVAVGHVREREARAQSALAMVDAALGSALENPGTAMSSVAEAEAAIAEARDAGASGESLAPRQETLASVRDKVWAIRRLGDVVRIGAPPGDLPAGPVRLALAGRTLYIAAGNLYELDPDGGRLVALLSRGDAAEGGTAGDLRQVSINGGHVVAGDGAATYVRDEAGRWQRQPLAVDEVGDLRPEAPLIAWGDGAYGLASNGDIIRFDQSAGLPSSAVWASAEDTPDLETAHDLAIDGRIQVLLEDGRTLTFSRGDLIGTVAPFIVPPLKSAAFLAEAPFSNVLYIVDRKAQVGENGGRIVRVDPAGDAYQILTPLPKPGDLLGNEAAVTLGEAEDLALDELTGTVYWVSKGEIWRANAPLL